MGCEEAARDGADGAAGLMGGWLVLELTTWNNDIAYPCHLAEVRVAVLDGNHSLAVTEIVNSASHEDHVSWGTQYSA